MEISNFNVFISHTHKDKERFVRNFAEKLAAKGIKVWYDDWELLPGDSLIDKIFEEGIKLADAVIIILSKESISSNWVKEELNLAALKRIENKTRLIPLILDLDDADIPTALRNTVWIRISNLESFDEELQRIYLSLIGKKNRPTDSNHSNEAFSQIMSIATLNQIDSIILKTICEIAITENSFYIDSQSLYEKLSSFNIPTAYIAESIEILEFRQYLTLYRDSSGISSIKITTIGFQEYATVYIKNYFSIYNSICYEIVNKGEEMFDWEFLIKKLNYSEVIIEHILNYLKLENLIDIYNQSGNSILIALTSPELKRRLETL